jgi:hypothetical protein
VRRPRVAPVPTIPDLQLTADRALSLHRPTRWQAQGQLCACRSLSLSLLPEVTGLDLHATEIAADRAMHPSTGSGQALRQAQGRPFGRLRAGPSAGSGQALRQAQGRPSPTGWLTSATLRFTDCAVPVAAWPGAQTGDDPPNGWVQPRGAVRTFGLKLPPPAPRRLQPVVSPPFLLGYRIVA